MSCYDCVHLNVCKAYEPEEVDCICNQFKNKADFVEVVRCDNCYLQGGCIVEDTFNTARMSDSMKFCAVGKRK